MKVFFVAVSVLFLAIFVSGQAPLGVESTSRSNIYVGYVATFPDYGLQFNSYRFNGAEIAYARSLRPHWDLIASGTTVSGSIFHAKQMSGTLGVKFSALTGHLRPYATAQVGYAHLTATNMYNEDHHPAVAPGKATNDSGLTYRGGFGVDLQMNRAFYWRAVQWDVQPQPWARSTPLYNNFSSGIGYRF